MRDDEEARLIEKLRKIEALFARPGTPGEKAAAGDALKRLRERLQHFERAERLVELRFTLGDTWSRLLFVALLRRYGLEPYRYPRQRRTTVMARVAPSFVHQVLWPEFQELNSTLRSHLHAVTMRVITQAIHQNGSEAEERPRGGAASAAGERFRG
jgi:hypothetical protein